MSTRPTGRTGGLPTLPLMFEPDQDYNNQTGASHVINPRIGAITLVVSSSEKLVNFYSQVFGVQFVVDDCDGHSIYTGTMGGVEFALVPFELSDVTATENKTHWDIIVDDLDAVIAAVENSGGKTNESLMEDDTVKCIGVFDPDGNFMPVKQMK